MTICQIPVNRNECEDLRIKCENCKYKDLCDYFWIENLWKEENKEFGKNTLLGPLNPSFLKPDLRSNKVISFTRNLDFLIFNNNKSKNYITISDIYIHPNLRGQGISKKLLDYVMEKYQKDIFAKCVTGTLAESFWQHIGEQIWASDKDILEKREGKRDLSWYYVKNKNKKIKQINLF